MPKVFIIKPITVNLSSNSDESVHLAPGLQDVSQELADHWFVKANSQALEDVQTDNVSAQIIESLRSELDTAKASLSESLELTSSKDKQIKEEQQKTASLDFELKNKDKQINGLTKQLQKVQADAATKDSRIVELEKIISAQTKVSSEPAKE